MTRYTTSYQFKLLSAHNFFGVGIGFKGVHITGHHLMAEGILGLWRKALHANVATRQCCIVTHSIRHKSRPLHAGRLDGLENVNHTLCLYTLQLGVDTQECSCAPNTITIGDSEFETISTCAHTILMCINYVCAHCSPSPAHDYCGLFGGAPLGLRQVVDEG